MLPDSTIEKNFCQCDMIKLWILKWEHYSGLSGKPLSTVTCNSHKKKVKGGFTHTRVCAHTGDGEWREEGKGGIVKTGAEITAGSQKISVATRRCKR